MNISDYFLYRIQRYIHTDNIVTLNGLKFYYDDLYGTLKDSFTDYSTDSIENKDIVLDIGANIGGFSLLASKKAKWVYSVEPIFSERLQNNITLNSIDNITVIEKGLGIEKKQIIFNGYSKIVDCIPLREIIKLCGNHIDLLKCDCEGGEWSIQYNSLKGIRHIEMEVHNDLKPEGIDYKFEDVLISAGFRIIRNIKINWAANLISAERIQ